MHCSTSKLLKGAPNAHRELVPTESSGGRNALPQPLSQSGPCENITSSENLTKSLGWFLVGTPILAHHKGPRNNTDSSLFPEQSCNKIESTSSMGMEDKKTETTEFRGCSGEPLDFLDKEAFCPTLGVSSGISFRLQPFWDWLVWDRVFPVWPTSSDWSQQGYKSTVQLVPWWFWFQNYSLFILYFSVLCNELVLII